MSKAMDGDLKNAQAKGQIVTLPEIKAEPVKVMNEVQVCDNAEDFKIAVGIAQMDGVDFVEVSERFFNYMTRGQTTQSFTYGGMAGGIPGVRVFKVGERAKILKEEGLSAEAHADLKARQRMAQQS